MTAPLVVMGAGALVCVALLVLLVGHRHRELARRRLTARLEASHRHFHKDETLPRGCFGRLTR